jgi:hypothetical protein
MRHEYSGGERKMNIEIREAFCNDLPAVLKLYSQLGMDDGEVLDLEKAEHILSSLKSPIW